MIKNQLKYLLSFVLLAAFSLPYLNLDFGHKSSCSHAEHHIHDASEKEFQIELECPPLCEHDAHFQKKIYCECSNSSVFIENLYLPQNQNIASIYAVESVFYKSFDIYFFCFISLNNKSPPLLS